jgi:hypothetical protein
MPAKNTNSASRTDGPATNARSASLAAALIIGIISGAAGGYVAGASPAKAKLEKAATEAAAAERRDILAALKKDGYIMEDPKVTSLTGTVESLENGVMILKSNLRGRSSLLPPLPETRRITLSTETKILKETPRPSAEVEEELRKANDAARKAMDEFAAQLRGTGDSPDPTPATPDETRPQPPVPELPAPALSTFETVDAASVTVGSVVTVFAAEDVYRSEAFTATEVRVLSIANERTSSPALEGGEVTTPFPRLDPKAAGIVDPAPTNEIDAPTLAPLPHRPN